MDLYRRGTEKPRATTREPLDYYQRTLEIRKNLLGRDHPGGAKGRNNMANIQSDQGDYAGALSRYRWTLTIPTSRIQ